MLTRSLLCASLALLLTLSGCLGWREFRKGLQVYPGQPLETMVARFGVPERSIELGGDPPTTAHTWKIRNEGGEYVCDVTATVDKWTSRVLKITDNCSNEA